MRRTLWVGLGLAACGPGTDPSPVTLPKVEYFGAGSRLVPTVASAEGGADYLLGWYDLELQTPCAFGRSTDSVLRCLPRSQGVIRFADPGCRDAFAPPISTSCAGSLEGLEPARFLSVGLGCNAEVYRVTSSPAPPDTERPGYLLDSNGTCQSESELRVGPQSVPLELLAPSELVAAQLGPGDAERSPGMKPWTLTAEDGAWEVRGFFDVERGGPCTLASSDADVSDQCLPSPQSSLPRPEPGCPGLGVRPSCEGAPAALYSVREDRTGECPSSRLELYEAEGPVQVRDCASGAASEMAPSVEGYRPGGTLSLGTLPDIERLHVGTGRLRLQFQGHAGVPYFPDAAARFASPFTFRAAFLDSRFDEPCWPQPLADDRFLCLSDAWEQVEPYLAANGRASCGLGESLAVRRKRE
ncbi:MAG: hypothetical protein RL033_3897, partial [Pseudomonadota bacterium]